MDETIEYLKACESKLTQETHQRSSMVAQQDHGFTQRDVTVITVCATLELSCEFSRFDYKG
jgi:hypothetical protein